ncbi:MAG TPA: hypothetical protein VF571_02045 [Pyrinomonadaceae bacterium]|jgi:hypothetical protein
MANAMIIFDGPGPLPQTATFKSPSDGPVVFVLSGTARTESAAVLIGINLSLDGKQIGSTAMCWANQNNNHQAMRTTYIPVNNLTFGEHTIEITNAYSNTITDVNDYCQVTLLY